MAYDGIQNSNRVEHSTDRKLYAKVVDNMLSSRTLFARIVGNGKQFLGKTYDYTIKVSDSNQGEFVSGMETLSGAASDTTIQLSYAHAAFTQPIVIPMLEAFANEGPTQVIDLSKFKVDEAGAEAIRRMGTAIYGTGSGNQPLGLGAIVDDGGDVATIGGQSRSTYSVLQSTDTASSGTVSLSKLATLYDNVSAAGIESEEPTLGVTTKTVWSLLEQLMFPSLQGTYSTLLPLRSSVMVKKDEATLKGIAGLTAFTYRGIPVIKDDGCTSGYLFLLNENYLDWRGRDVVPAKFAPFLEKVNLGEPSTMEGRAVAPSKYHGFFHQKEQMTPSQAGLIGRLWVIGQLMTSQPRRHGRLTGITGV